MHIFANFFSEDFDYKPPRVFPQEGIWTLSSKSGLHAAFDCVTSALQLARTLNCGRLKLFKCY